jgi:hypothetical protein
VSPEQFALAARAWEAFRAPAPRPLEDLVHTDTSQLPFLAAALRRHLEELPWTVDGLSRSERRLMALAQAGPIDIWTAFPRMHEGETAFYISDLSLWTLIVGLTRATPPLLTAAVTSREKHQLPRGSLSLTETGRAVLAGAVDRVRRCGVDRWQGGVHVQGSAETWRWDEAHERVVRA